MNNYYIYFHINPLKNEVFYVGKGKDKRAWSYTGRSLYWTNIVKKYSYIVDIVEENLTEQEAFDREIFYINKIGRKDLGLGSLINMTDGGDGPSGAIRSQETIEKTKQSRKGYKTSDETKKKMSKSQTGRKQSDQAKKKVSEARKGKTLSEEHKRKLSESHKGKTLSEEHIKKVADANRGKKRGPYKKNKNTK
jgi:hypothetical protein